MAFQKRYKTIVPILRPAGVDPLTELGADGEHQDYAIARWLGRESFELTAAGDRLQLIEYTERLVSIDEVNPLLFEKLGRPVADFEWFEFSGVGELDQAAFDWFSAEFVWKCEQWLAAEREWLEAAAEAEHLAVTTGGA